MIVSVTGPESSGKTVLSRILADRLKGLCVPEFARRYLKARGGHYTYDDLLSIAKGQHELLAQAVRMRKSTVVMDTDISVIKIWSEFRFGKTAVEVDSIWKDYSPNIFLLCYPDIPWKADPLRESPDDSERLELFQLYRNLLAKKNVPVEIISGSFAEREAKALRVIRSLGEG